MMKFFHMLLATILIPLLTAAGERTFVHTTSASLKRITKQDTSLVALSSISNTIYFATKNGHLQSYTPATGESKRIAGIAVDEFSTSIVLNNKLYIGSLDDNLYEYDPNEVGIKIVAEADHDINGITQQGNKIYYASHGGTLYEYNPKTGENKNVSYVNAAIFGLTTLNKRIYFGTNIDKLYEFDPKTHYKKVIASTSGSIFSVTTMNNKVFFRSDDANLREYNPVTSQLKSVCQLGTRVRSLTILNRAVYIGVYGVGSVFKFNPAAEEAKCELFAETTAGTTNSLAALNGKLYIGSSDGSLYEYYEEINIGGLQLLNNLMGIVNNSETVILNELNFLNPELDISQLDVVNITSNSAIIKAKNNNNYQYTGEKKVYFYIETNKITNLTALLQKGLILSYKNNNEGNYVKEIREMTTEYLKFSEVMATISDEHIKRNKYHESICFGSLLLKYDNFNKSQGNMQTPDCKYIKWVRIANQIEKGLLMKTSKEANYQQQNWNRLLGEWPFASVKSDSVVFNIAPRDNFMFDDNLGLDEYMEKTEVNVPPQTFITVLRKKCLNISASVEVQSEQATLNLKQSIYGTVSANALNIFNEEITIKVSIKEIMENLKDSGLLPPEITINGEDSVTFHGKLYRKLERRMKAFIQYSEI